MVVVVAGAGRTTTTVVPPTVLYIGQHPHTRPPRGPFGFPPSSHFHISISLSHLPRCLFSPKLSSTRIAWAEKDEEKKENDTAFFDLVCVGRGTACLPASQPATYRPSQPCLFAPERNQTRPAGPEVGRTDQGPTYKFPLSTTTSERGEGGREGDGGRTQTPVGRA